MKKFTDEELVSSYLETQENDYFEQLYERYCHKVHRKCLSFTKDSDLAQDLTQDIFLRLMIKLKGYKQQSKFSTWLYSMTYNYCADQIRTSTWRYETILDEGWESLNLKTEDGAHEQDEIRAWQLQQAMLRLAPDEQDLLQQKYQDDVSIRELAKRYSITESAIKMRLKRSRDRLRKYYVEQLAD